MAVKQHGYKEALGLGDSGERLLGAPLWLDSSYLLCLLCSAMHQSAPFCPAPVCSALLRHLCYFSSSWGSHKSSVFSVKEKCTLQGREELTYIDRCSCQWFLPMVPDWFILMQMRIPKTQSLVQNALPWLVRMEPLWLVGDDVDGDIATQL